eukprot:1237870-Amphidinium_carterae.1
MISVEQACGFGGELWQAGRELELSRTRWAARSCRTRPQSRASSHMTSVVFVRKAAVLIGTVPVTDQEAFLSQKYRFVTPWGAFPGSNPNHVHKGEHLKTEHHESSSLVSPGSQQGRLAEMGILLNSATAEESFSYLGPQSRNRPGV